MTVDLATAAFETQVSIPTQRTTVNQNIFDSFFERSGLCVAHFDHSGRVVQANGDFCRQFGRTPREVHGREFGEFLHPSVREKITQQLGRLVYGQRARFTDRIVALRPGDAAFTAELTGLAINGLALGMNLLHFPSYWFIWMTPGPSKSGAMPRRSMASGSTSAIPPGQASCTSATFGW